MADRNQKLNDIHCQQISDEGGLYMTSNFVVPCKSDCDIQTSFVAMQILIYFIKMFTCISSFQDTSEWTLDYPPFFAWFEYFLSLIAAAIDPSIVNINNLSYSSWFCVVFQRLSVICTEVMLCLAVIV